MIQYITNLGEVKMGYIEESKTKASFVEKEQKRIFKQCMQEFYIQNQEEQQATMQEGNIKIEPKLLYEENENKIKIEFSIGETQNYKIKNLSEFYDRMLKKETYRYGSKLQIQHDRKVFREEDQPLLAFLLKYAEIAKYANEALNGYSYYGKKLAESTIVLSNTALDELYDIMKNKTIAMQKRSQIHYITFSTEQKNIEYYIVPDKENGYKMVPNIDVFAYEILKGKEYSYMLLNDTLYRISKQAEATTLKLLEFYKKNYTKEIVFSNTELAMVYSVLIAKMENSIHVEKVKKEDKEAYIPKPLHVKVYLDYDERQYLTASIQFAYGKTQFNPLLQQQLTIPRNIISENDALAMFQKTGFLLDAQNQRLILTDDEKIYQFLTEEIQDYMNKFDILATEKFKAQEIRQPKMVSLGVRIENELLNIQLENMDIDFSELAKILEKYKMKKKFHRLKDGSFVNLEQNDAIQLLDNMVSGMDLHYSDLEKKQIKVPIYRSLYLERLLEKFPGVKAEKDEHYYELMEQITNRNEQEYCAIPTNLTVTLRDYQKVGFQWLKTLERYGLGGILADDMGLGKTLQMIAVLQAYLNQESCPKTSIIVCPSSLVLNWKNEIAKFAPTMKVNVISGTQAEREEKIAALDNYDIVITSYDLLKRDVEAYEKKDYTFKYIVADEAQYIKNNNTQNSKVIKQMHAENRFALTGTPIENSLSELWSIFDFIMPDYLFSYRKFKELYELPIVRDNDQNAMKRLKNMIEPFILRRVKQEVLTELPDKTITVLYNEMQEEQKKIYLSYMAQAREEALQIIQREGVQHNQIRILALLMRLRQICCHPSLFMENYKEGSSKLTQCMEIMKDAVKAGHKILLFSGYTSMFKILEKELKKEGIAYYKLTGQTKVGERMHLVDSFNKDPEIKVFLISLKAGGTGLNLTGADMVIHYDPWWNLSAENQATDRTYRIGQKNNVQVYKLITQNTIEERMYELQQKKSKLIDQMLSTNETFISKLSKEEIMQLFR